MLGIEFQRAECSAQSVVLFRRAALSAVGLIFRRQNPHRHAGAAMVAIGPIGKRTGAAKTQRYQLTVGGAVDQITRRCDLRTSKLTGQIAARIRRGRVELQFRGRYVIHVGQRLAPRVVQH